MNDLFTKIIVLTLGTLFFFIGSFFFLWKNRLSEFGASSRTHEPSIKPKKDEFMAPRELDPRWSCLEKIKVENQFGQSIFLSKIDSQSAISTKKFREVIMRGNAIGGNLFQGAIPVLAEAQTIAQIQEAASGGLFTATAPISELLKYKDGTTSSMVMESKNIARHSGFKNLSIPKIHPAAFISAGMQAMACISGQYYMSKISGDLLKINKGIERLIGFHHDTNIGILRSAENKIREIVAKIHVDETDIIALQAGIREADSVLMEYTTRLDRLKKTNEISEIQVTMLWSRLSAAKEIKKLSENAKEQELFFSFQICLFACKIFLEGKKAEFATRLKMGEIEKAVEAFDSFSSFHSQSFIRNASDLLKSIYQPINDKAKFLMDRQWFESERTKKEFQLLDAKKNDMEGFIDLIAADESDEEMIRKFKEEMEIVYVPSEDGRKERMYISVDE